jgi:hypothetical protein
LQFTKTTHIKRLQLKSLLESFMSRPCPKKLKL